MSIQTAMLHLFFVSLSYIFDTLLHGEVLRVKGELGGRFAGVLRDPDADRGVFGEGGEDHVSLTEAPEFAGYDGGVGHGAAGLHAGYEGGGAGSLRDVGGGSLCQGAGEGAGGDALPGADAGEFGEDGGAVDVVFIDGGPEGRDIADGDPEGGRGRRDGPGGGGAPPGAP